jgi:hypothetical protein
MSTWQWADLYECCRGVWEHTGYTPSQVVDVLASHQWDCASPTVTAVAGVPVEVGLPCVRAGVTDPVTIRAFGAAFAQGVPLHVLLDGSAPANVDPPAVVVPAVAEEPVPVYV